MERRRIRLTAAAMALTAGLAGCTATPEPTSTPTPTALFSSEDEAFKAAEQLYRAYVDETNAKRDGDSDADPNEWLSGLALETALEEERSFEKHGLKVQGPTSIAAVTLISSNLTSTPPRVEIKVCLDVSQARLFSERGQDLTSPDRALRAPTIITVHFPEGRPTITDAILPKEKTC